LSRRLDHVCTAALAALALLTGCTTDQGLVTLAATQPVQLDVRNVEIEKLPAVRDVEGSHTAVTSVLFFPTFAGPRLELAVEDALAHGRGDVLTRAQVTTTKWWLLIGVETITVRGNVVDLPEAP
jgi:hypothetical protein